jgi:hypothetical protein
MDEILAHTLSSITDVDILMYTLTKIFVIDPVERKYRLSGIIYEMEDLGMDAD